MLAPESPPVRYGRIQHAGVLVKDTALSKQFYMHVFGMEDDDALRNPKLPFKGSFLKAGSSQIHLMQLPSPDPEQGRPEHGGRYVSLCNPLSLSPLCEHCLLTPFVARFCNLISLQG